MNKEKVLNCTTDLKLFFTSKKMRVGEIKETVFRLIDYIDGHYDDDSRDKFFTDSYNSQNRKIYKPISFIKNNKTRHTQKNGLHARLTG